MSLKPFPFLATVILSSSIACGAGDKPGLTYGQFRQTKQDATWQDYVVQTIGQAARASMDTITAARRATPEQRADALYLRQQTVETARVAVALALCAKPDSSDATVDLLDLYRDMERTRREKRLNVSFNTSPVTPHFAVATNRDVRENFKVAMIHIVKAVPGSRVLVDPLPAADKKRVAQLIFNSV